MNIALYNLTTTTKVGGVESFVWDLSRELVQRGHRVTIIGGVGTRREFIAGVEVITFPFISRRVWQSLPLLRRAYAEAKLLERLSFALAALPQLVRGKYDIIHIQKPYDMAPALLARILGRNNRKGRVVLGCHGEDFYRGDWVLARFVNATVSCSQFNARTVSERYSSCNIRVVYNGFDATLFRRVLTDPIAYRVHLGVHADAPLLLYVGRLMPWKGVDTAIDALCAVPDAVLLIAGDGEERRVLEAQAHRVGVSSRVRFLGTVAREQLPVLYSSVDMLVATSYASETFGISLVEAQACGVPVIASRFGGFPEVIDEGRTGLLVPPRDANALAAAIRTLLAQPAQRAAMASAAPTWAAQFVWRAVADRIEAAYRAALTSQN